MTTSKINDITKHQFGGENFIYYFGTCIVNVSGDEIQYLYFNNETPFRFNFSALDEKYGTTTAELFVDYLANNNFFVSKTDSDAATANQITQINDFERIIELLNILIIEAKIANGIMKEAFNIDDFSQDFDIDTFN